MAHTLTHTNQQTTGSSIHKRPSICVCTSWSSYLLCGIRDGNSVSVVAVTVVAAPRSHHAVISSNTSLVINCY